MQKIPMTLVVLLSYQAWHIVKEFHFRVNPLGIMCVCGLPKHNKAELQKLPV